MDWAQLLVVYSTLCVEIETASIKPQRSADVTRGYHPFPIPLTLQSMIQHIELETINHEEKIECRTGRNWQYWDVSRWWCVFWHFEVFNWRFVCACAQRSHLPPEERQPHLPLWFSRCLDFLYSCKTFCIWGGQYLVGRNSILIHVRRR